MEQITPLVDFPVLTDSKSRLNPYDGQKQITKTISKGIKSKISNTEHPPSCFQHMPSQYLKFRGNGKLNS